VDISAHPAGAIAPPCNAEYEEKRSSSGIKQIFRSAHIPVTTLKRTSVKMIFAAFKYNLQQLKTLKKTGLVVSI